ncbi:tRNA lysidine(34) synthetase TilS [Desulfococcus sp.]|uniref:tRNA lysidine(34) synthetase TilS n=1 Tax=Desulfococcus sp. TaxID=2025834 RepID=UPI003D09CF46
MKKSPFTCDHNLIQTVVKTIVRHDMLTPGDVVLVGVSGGPDSVALLHVLVRIAERLSFSIGVAHLNHGLRGGASDGDARFVAEIADALHLPCHSARREVAAYRRTRKLSPEEAARSARYEFFEDTAVSHGYNKIALGHHADDNAELVMMYLLRGSGPAGIAGIPPVRDGRYVRPMSNVSRRQIIAFLSKNGIGYRIDGSNADVRFTRNRIRHRLIPMLQKDYNPRISHTLNRLADILRAEEEWLDPLVREMFERCRLKGSVDSVVLSVPELDRIGLAPRRRIIRMAISRIKGDLRRIELAHIDRVSVEMLAVSSVRTKTIHLPDRIRVTRTDAALCICRESVPLRRMSLSSSPPDYDYQVADVPTHWKPTELRIAEIGGRLQFSMASVEDVDGWRKTSPDTAFFDMAAIHFPLTVRNFRPGDRFTPLGFSGTQKLKAFFINNKIPVALRRQCPLLLSDEKIIWVVGHRIAEKAKVVASSKNLLKVQLLLA